MKQSSNCWNLDSRLRTILCVALTQTDLDNLDRAIASAELEVEIDGQRVKYRSIRELKDARSHVAGVIAGTPAGGRANVFQFGFTTRFGD